MTSIKQLKCEAVHDLAHPHRPLLDLRYIPAGEEVGEHAQVQWLTPGPLV